MSQARVWTEKDFDSMSWHDNHVHALRIVEGQDGVGELVLDIDHIVEWLPSNEEGYHFKIVPAELRFKNVTDLRIALNYGSVSAALAPFSLDKIESHFELRPTYQARLWSLSINWPSGVIAFEATGYEQRATGVEVISNLQRLTLEERVRGA